MASSKEKKAKKAVSDALDKAMKSGTLSSLSMGSLANTYSSAGGSSSTAKKIAAGSSGSSRGSGSSSKETAAQSAAQSVIDKAIASGNLADLKMEDVTSAYTAAGGSASKAAEANAGASKITPTTPSNTYTVKAGDTLNSIAQAQGYANYREAGITSVPSGNFNLIRPGDVITIGGKATTPTSATVTSDEITETIKEEEETTPVPLPETMTYEDFKAKYAPTVEAPVKTNYADQYTKQREALGISAIEDEIGGYDAEKEELLANLQKFKQKEYAGQPLGFARGRISVEEQGIQDRLDFITRQENAAIDKLNYKNSYLETLMSLTEKDYNTARDEYEWEFNKNLQLADAFSDEQDKIKKDAQVTQTTILNGLKDSGKTWDDLTPKMQADINARDLQAYGVSGVSKLALEALPEDTEISKTTGTDESGNDFIAIVSKNKSTGEISVNRIYTGGVSTKKTDISPTELKNAIDSQLKNDNLFGSDKKVSYETYLWMNQNWINNKGKQDEFAVNYPITQYLDEDNQELYLSAINQ